MIGSRFVGTQDRTRMASTPSPSTERTSDIIWTGYKSQSEKDRYWKLKHKQQKSFQKIELQTSMKYYRKMNPGNDVFKMLRCQAIVDALNEQKYACCDPNYLVFEGQEAEWIEELRHRAKRQSGPSNIMLMRREGVDTAIMMMKIGMAKPDGSAERDLAADICHQIRIIDDEFRDVVAEKVYNKMKEDYQTKKRYIPGFKREQEWAKLQENVSRNDAFESRSALMHR
eukprot:2556987-Amphidinium_carterae.1